MQYYYNTDSVFSNLQAKSCGHGIGTILVPATVLYCTVQYKVVQHDVNVCRSFELDGAIRDSDS